MRDGERKNQILSFRTKGNSNPQGKSRVYFTCHPEDFARSFERICTDIFTAHDCAIYYTEDMSAEIDSEYRDTDLGQMNLFVIPVSFRLLTKPNRAMDFDFPFAMNLHIPVLPILIEQNIDEIYSRPDKFGELQYLDPFNKDITAINYEKKLKNYLKSVLVSDEMAQRIRAAFDAYIFLSYRKKDRQYANQLMRLIHKNPQSRDVAIWYDEFLTPGENFNESIREAMNKSELFALLVTPNLVSEENYVHTIEYPKAQETGMAILPVEMVATDRRKLEEQYQKIPKCVAGKDNEAFHERLLETIGKIGRQESAEDPIHNYLIGLAYLEGIDVETDLERGRKLIELSARSGLEEAIEKLVSMYQSGYGVSRNYECAIQWQRRLIELRRCSYDREMNASSAYELICAMENLAIQYSRLGKIDEEQKLYEEMSYIANQYREDRICLECLANIYERLSGIYIEKNLNEAECCINEALRIEDILDKHISIGKSICYEKLGNIFLRMGKYFAAEREYEKAFSIRRFISEERKDYFSQRGLAVIYHRVGNLYFETGEIEKAEQCYKCSLEICVSLNEEAETEESVLDVAASFTALGDVQREKRELSLAIENYQEALSCARKLTEDTGVLDGYRNMGVCYGKLGTVYQTEGNVVEAERNYKEGMAIQKKLADETGTYGAKRDLEICYAHLGDLYLLNGNIQAAEEFFEKSLAMIKEIVRDTNSLEDYRHLYVIYEKIGDTHSAKKRYDDAEKNYILSLQWRKRQVEKANTLQNCRDLSICYTKIGELHRKIGNLKKTKEFYMKGIDTLEEICKIDDETEMSKDILSVLATEYSILGGVCVSLEDLRETEDHYRRCIAIRSNLAQKTKLVRDYEDLVRSKHNLADIMIKINKLDEAEMLFHECISIYDKLNKRIPDKYTREIRECMYNLIGIEQKK